MTVTFKTENGIYHFSGRSPQLTQEKNKLLQPENKMLFNKESKRNPHPNINLGGDEFLFY